MLNETLSSVNISNIDFSSLFTSYHSDMIEINQMDIIRQVCTNWYGSTYNSHYLYASLFFYAFIFYIINKIFKFKIPKSKEKTFTIFNKTFSYYRNEHDLYVFKEIGDLFISIMFVMIFYNFFNQYFNIERHNLIQFIRDIILGGVK